MGAKAKIINLNPTDGAHNKKILVEFNSGYNAVFDFGKKEEVIEITEPKGEVILKIRMHDDGPVVSIHGTRLELKSTESISMKAKKINIQAEEQAVFKSKGSLEIDSLEKMGINSNDNIRLTGKMIYLN